MMHFLGWVILFLFLCILKEKIGDIHNHLHEIQGITAIGDYHVKEIIYSLPPAK